MPIFISFCIPTELFLIRLLLSTATNILITFSSLILLLLYFYFARFCFFGEFATPYRL